jgi:hypothetical protein
MDYFHFSVFSVIWGICFSLKANPNGTKNIAFGHTFGTGTHLLFHKIQRASTIADTIYFLAGAHNACAEFRSSMTATFSDAAFAPS